MDGRGGQGLLGAVEMLLSKVYIPAFKAMNKGWERLNSPDGMVTRMGFFNALESFSAVLSGQFNKDLDRL